MGEALMLLYKCLKWLMVCLIASKFVEFFEKYIFSDWSFATFLLVAVGFDTVLSLIYHWRAGTISSAGWNKIGVKLITYFALLFVAHFMRSYVVDGVGAEVFFWIDDVVYGYMIVREALSIIENTEKIRPGSTPYWLVKRLKVFKDTGKVEIPEGFENEARKGNTEENIPAK